MSDTNDGDKQADKLLLAIIAFFLPPLAVALNDGVGTQLLLNIVLLLLAPLWGIGWVLAIVHAEWRVFSS